MDESISSLKVPTSRMTVDDIRRELKDALEVWSRNTTLKFEEVHSNSDADIQITFRRGDHGDGYRFDGKGKVLAHAFFPGRGQGGDAHFDDDEEWITSYFNERNLEEPGTVLYSVAAHEFGHSLGLSHSDVQRALMYPWYQTFGRDSNLHEDDVNGIQQLYGFISKWAPNPFGTRRPYRPAHTPRVPSRRPTDERPNACDSSYDAISMLQGELFIFKGKYYWRFRHEGGAERVPPVLIREMWSELPENLTHIDAVYERNGRDIVFFLGRNYWIFSGSRLMRKGTLDDFKIAPSVKKLDGALVWGHNGKTYLFSGSQYWRLDDTNPDKFEVEPDYPRDMYVWKGVPYDIDSVFRYKDHKTYFFKGKVFWTFDDKRMKVSSDTPVVSAPFWMGCTSGGIVPTKTASTATSISPSRVFIVTVLMYLFLL